MRLMTLLL